MILLFNLLTLLTTFYFLMILSEKFFVPSLEILAKKLKMNSEVAGATLMAVGSSAPELFTSLFALFQSTENLSIGAGTIVGSALFNILVIIGASALFMGSKQKLAWQPVIRDMIFYIFAIVLLLIFFWDGKVYLWEATILIFIYIIYIFMVKNWARWLGYNLDENRDQKEKRKLNNNFNILIEKILSFIIPKNPKYYFWSFLLSIFTIAGISYLMVESAVNIAHILKIPGAIIGLTILAIGTSVPDLLSSIIVAKKGKADMAVSNAVGSNIFDIFIGLGFIYTIYFLFINKTAEYIIVDNHNLTSSILLLFGTVLSLIFLLLAQKWKLTKYSGWILITLYLSYLMFNIFKVLS